MKFNSQLIQTVNDEIKIKFIHKKTRNNLINQNKLLTSIN